MPDSKRNTQVRISRETADTLRRLAADLGYVQTRGILAGELGSIAQMLDAVARGGLIIVKTGDKRAQSSAPPPTPADAAQQDAENRTRR